MKKTNLIENRQIRVFISSTFRDMLAERDYLIHYVFPALKKYCAERDVTFTEIDLRWGIDEKLAEQGKVAEVCLQEIENTHPFFIGLLGERYGWIPTKNELNLHVKERYPWIKQDLLDSLSITEVEMQYGVLRSKEEINAYFFLRSTEMKTPAKFKEKPDSKKARKLSRLKSEICSQNKYPVSKYTSVVDLGKQVEAHFKALVDRLYPRGILLTWEKEHIQQKAFLRSHTNAYIPMQDYFDRLDRFISGHTNTLVIAGESGMGKSALIANWIARSESKQYGHLVYHFIGKSDSESNYTKITRQLIDEIKSAYGLIDEDKDVVVGLKISLSPDRKKDELGKLLVSVADKGLLLIVLDGVNQLDDQAKLLNWLPDFPPNVKVIYTTTPADSTMEVFTHRRYDLFLLQTLGLEEREKLIVDYLKIFSKSLLPEQVKRIAADKENENLLVLRTLLDELRVFGVYEEIDNQINHYLNASSVSHFFQLMLERIEKVYHVNDIDYVKNVLSLLAVSRAGLFETEIMEIAEVAPLYWVSLYNAISGHLAVKNGLVAFAHQHLRDAVWDKYLSDRNVEKEQRGKIVDYISGQKEQTNRDYEEWVYQLDKQGLYGALHDLLLNPNVFECLYVKDEYELGRYWKTLVETDRNKYSLEKYLVADTQNLTKDAKRHLFNNLGVFINSNFSDPLLALKCLHKSLTIVEETLGENHPEIATLCSNMGLMYNEIGDYSKALEFLQKAQGIPGVNSTIIYINLGVLHNSKRDYPQALEYFQKAIDIQKETLSENHPDMATSYSNIGTVYIALKDYAKALEYHQKAWDIRKKMFGENHPATASSYHKIGGIYGHAKNPVRALEFYQKALTIREKTLGSHLDTASSYHNAGESYFIIDEYEKALVCFQQALKIRKEILGENHLDTAISYHKVGHMYYALRDDRKSLEYHQKSLAIKINILGENHIKTANIYHNIGEVYLSMESYAESLAYFRKALTIKIEAFGESHNSVAYSYERMICVYESMNDNQNLLECYLQLYKIQEEILPENHQNIADTCCNIGGLLNMARNFPMSIAFLQQALKITEKNKGEKHQQTASLYNNIAHVCASAKDYEKSIEYYKQSLLIREEILGRHNDTAMTYNNIGYVYSVIKNYQMALAAYQKALSIQEEMLGCHPDTANSYFNIGFIYNILGDYSQALAYHQKALKQREELLGKTHKYTISSCQNIASVYESMGSPDKAAEYRQKAIGNQ